MSRYIKNLILQGEHQQQDFKYAISDSRKIARSLSAFANTKGGRLLIGVKDNGAIAGVKSDEEIYMIEAAADIFCKPAVDFSVKSWNIQGKTIVEITIPESKNKPHLAEKDNTWLAYVRVEDENILANIVWLKYWKFQKAKEGVRLQYSEPEKILLKNLKNYDFITLEDFITEAGITRKTATSIIARMAALDILEIQFYDSDFIYRLK